MRDLLRLLCCFIALLSALGNARYTLGADSLDEEEIDYARIIKETLEAAPPGSFNGLNAPTPPIRSSRALPDWETASAVMVNVAAHEILETPELLQFYRQLIDALTRHLPVIVGYDGEDSRYEIRLEDALQPESSEKVDRFGIEVIDSRSNSYWIKDYGPVFTLTDKGRLVLADSIYREGSFEIDSFESQLASKPSSLANEIDRQLKTRSAQQKSDVAPLSVMKILRQSLRVTSDTTRPPLILAGSDFQSDGNGRFFTTEEVVLLNGGRVEHTLAGLKSYFGAKEVHLLETLPGWGAPRLDIFFKLIDSHTALLSRPEFAPAANASILVDQAKQVFASNRNYVANAFPSLRLIEVPTLPISLPSRQATVESVRQRLLLPLCAEIGIDFELYKKASEGDPRKVTADRLINKWLSEKEGEPLAFNSDKDLNTISFLLAGRSLEALVKEQRAYLAPIRSYASSLVVRLQDGNTVIVLPRYGPSENCAPEKIHRIEREVEQSYLEAYPGAILHWIDADAIVKRGGSIYRSALALPKSKSSS